MFNKLMASGPKRRLWLRNPTVIVVSVVVHVLLLAGVVWATSAEEIAEEEREPEEITYIDVTELPEPEVVYEAPPEEPAPEEPAPEAPRNPETPQMAPRPTPEPVAEPAPEEPAGFQELEIPDVNVQGIPEPDFSAEAVDPKDFRGRGTAGGTAAGTAPPPPAPPGTGTGTGVDTNRTYTERLVEEPAALRNRGDIARILSRNYPRTLRDAGITGRVVVQFVVNQDGRVESSSVKIISASKQEFGSATREALEEFRFRPGKVGGQSVRQLVQIPIEWNVSR